MRMISILHQQVSKRNLKYLFDNFDSDLFFLDIANADKPPLQRRDALRMKAVHVV